MTSLPHDQKHPIVSVDIIVEANNRILFGKLSDKWADGGKYEYGLPGSEIRFGETIGETTKRTVAEQLSCEVTEYKITGVNVNHALNNHYVSIAVVVKITGDPKVVHADDWQSWEWFNVHNLPEKLFDSASHAIRSYITKTFTVSE